MTATFTANDDFTALRLAAQAVPTGRWVIGVSGGADSVALLRIIHAERADVSLVVAHLNHQTRGEASDGDAAFIQLLCRSLNVPSQFASRDAMESLKSNWPRNRSACFRAMRRTFFEKIIADFGAQGLLLAHHRDDQAETIFHRLLRGSSFSGICGMDSTAQLGSMTVHRPLLHVSRQLLRDFLFELRQDWREDASNASDGYARNRLRKILTDRHALRDCFIELGDRNRALRDWLRAQVGQADERLDVDALLPRPRLLQQETIRQWMSARGVPREMIAPAVIARIEQLCSDAAAPRSINLPASLRARRRRGVIEIV